MLELEQALKQILAAVPQPQSERISLLDAHRRVLAEDVSSPIDLPVFDNSAMDGYAVRADDVGSAKPAAPVPLRLLGRVAAGENFEGVLLPGTCVRLFTGSPLPRGADAVVMQEDVRVSDQPPSNQIWILEAAKPWENVRFRGEDLKRGARLAQAGQLLTPGRMGLLAAAGLKEVSVRRQPTVALLATGSELREPGQPLASGQIFESNRLALAALTREAGAFPRIFPLVADVLTRTRSALLEAFEQCQIVITSGGVSVGEMDFVKKAFEEAGGQLQFWRVAIRPGRPFVFGRWPAGKLLFGLPGNPASALVTFLLLVRPALLHWQGASEVNLPSQPGVLAEPLTNPSERRHFMRVRVDAAGQVFLAGTQASHTLSSLAAANGLVDVPPRTTWGTGTSVQVLRWA